MTNKEYYKDEIFNIACQGDAIAFDVLKHKIVSCDSMSCLDCKFSIENNCKKQIQEWLEEEYVEYIDWSKVEVDTKILVSNYANGEYVNRHFAKYEDGTIYAFTNGHSSWTIEDDDDITGWKYAILYDEG